MGKKNKTQTTQPKNQRESSRIQIRSDKLEGGTSKKKLLDVKNLKMTNQIEINKIQSKSDLSSGVAVKCPNLEIEICSPLDLETVELSETASIAILPAKEAEIVEATRKISNTEVEMTMVSPDSEIEQMSSSSVAERRQKCGSWASEFRSNRSKTSEGALHFIPPAVKNGARIVRFQSPKDMKWKNSVVASVFGESPKFFRFQNFAMNRWKDLGLQSVHLIKDNIFLLDFDCAENRTRMLRMGPITFNRQPLLMQEWTERMNLGTSAVTKLPVWIHLPLLPLELWTTEILSGIGSICGKPLFVDQCTLNQTRLGYARLLIEMDMLGDFPRETILEDELGNQFTQEISYEWLPTRCSKCRKVGHSMSQCVVTSPTSKVWVPKEKQGYTQDYNGHDEMKGSPKNKMTSGQNLMMNKERVINKDLKIEKQVNNYNNPKHSYPQPQTRDVEQVEEWPKVSGTKNYATLAPKLPFMIEASRNFTKEPHVEVVKMKNADADHIGSALGAIGGVRKSARETKPPDKYG